LPAPVLFDGVGLEFTVDMFERTAMGDMGGDEVGV